MRRLMFWLGAMTMTCLPVLSFADGWQELHRETRVFDAVKKLELTASTKERLRENMYVRSAVEFAIHTVAHIQRVQILGRVAQKEISQFHELSPGLVEDYLRLHDRAKINFSDQFLRLHHLGLYTHPLFLLAEHYGIAKGEDDGVTRAIDRVNKLDQLVTKNFLLARGLMKMDGELTPRGKLLIDLERLVDVVDTAMSQVRAEEMGRATISASLWFLRQGEFDLSQAARELELQYEKLVAPAEYFKVRAEVIEQLDLGNEWTCSDLLRRGSRGFGF